MGYTHVSTLKVAKNELGFQELCRKCYKNEGQVQAGRKDHGEGELLIRKGNRLGYSQERENMWEKGRQPVTYRETPR